MLSSTTEVSCCCRCCSSSSSLCLSSSSPSPSHFFVTLGWNGVLGFDDPIADTLVLLQSQILLVVEWKDPAPLCGGVVWILDFSNGVYWFVGLVCSCCLFAMSCPEILATWVSGETGFQWDRQWVVVNERGRFITQRQEPKLALVKVSLPPEVLHDSWGPLPKNAFLCEFIFSSLTNPCVNF